MIGDVDNARRQAIMTDEAKRNAQNTYAVPAVNRHWDDVFGRDGVSVRVKAVIKGQPTTISVNPGDIKSPPKARHLPALSRFRSETVRFWSELFRDSTEATVTVTRGSEITEIGVRPFTATSADGRTSRHLLPITRSSNLRSGFI